MDDKLSSFAYILLESQKLALVVQKLLAKMTQPSLKTDTKAPSSAKTEGRFYLSENCIQVTAWLLLTVGLCIIVSTFYLAMAGRATVDDAKYESSTSAEDIETIIELDKNIRTRIKVSDSSYIDTATGSLQGCEEKLCKTICKQASNIYESLHKSLSLSNCLSTDFLMIKNQTFAHGIVRNAWTPIEHAVHELVLSSSNITIIKSGAFNSPIFSSINFFSWYNLNLKIVGGGALLGLHSLKYLIINTQIDYLDRAFFQPVQTTLKHLVLNAGLPIDSNEDLFGISNLEKLEYVDLSSNNFLGPLSKKCLLSAPNIKYLIITDSQITSVQKNAFENLVGKLLLLNLSRNLLTTISADAIQPILVANSKTIVTLSMNSWICDCNLAPFVKTYTKYRSQFIDVLYCKSPHHLYGTLINEIDFSKLNCEGKIDQTNLLSTTTLKNVLETAVPDQVESTEATTDEVFHMRCLNNMENIVPKGGLNTNINITETQIVPGEAALDAANIVLSNDLEIIQFDRPKHDVELMLHENRSVTVTIAELKEATNVIWFTDGDQDLSEPYLVEPNVSCSHLSVPNVSLTTEPLEEDKTYTFCWIAYNSLVITPFDCLPLHVPKVKQTEDIWISDENKQFTLGMLCLIFALSTFFGAAIAYFGIKAYPDLLEGSKNVLVVKKSDRTCYVATISETEYMKNASLTKKNSSSSTKKLSLNSSLPDTYSNESSSPGPYDLSAKNLERLTSVKSTSTCFEDPFLAKACEFNVDEYEIPSHFIGKEIYKEHCVPNNYATSPTLPPPLPKRNSTKSDNVEIITNRFGKWN